MIKQKPHWQRLYEEREWYELARAIGYEGCTYRQLNEKIEELGKHFDKRKLESAAYHLVTFEGQMTVKPKPLVKVEFRSEIRKLCWQLLGPPPEHPDYARAHPDAKKPRKTKTG
jgi:hypothetical protein